MNSFKTLLIIILLIACMGQVASDIYTPSFVAIADSLHIRLIEVQLSMSIYMLGLALSQLVYGPLSEAFGRRLPLLAGLMILCLGGLICLFSFSIDQLILGRLIQGLGAGACIVLWRSIFKDVYS